MTEIHRAGVVGEAIKAAKQTRKTTLGYVQGLTPQDFLWRPANDANSILWLLWHVGEVEESVLWAVHKKAPVWHFGQSVLKMRGENEGFPRPEEVLKYLSDVRTRFLDWLQNFKDEALDEDMGEGVWQGRGQGFLFLASRHESYHCGQISYVRRLMGKPVPDRNEANPYQ